MDLALFKELISYTYEKEWLEMPTSIITTMNLTIPAIFTLESFPPINEGCGV